MEIIKYLKPDTGNLPPDVKMFYRLVEQLNSPFAWVHEHRIFFGSQEAFDKFEKDFPEMLPYLQDES